MRRGWGCFLYARVVLLELGDAVCFLMEKKGKRGWKKDKRE